MHVFVLLWFDIYDRSFVNRKRLIYATVMTFDPEDWTDDFTKTIKSLYLLPES